MPDFQLDKKRLGQLDGNIKQMISLGASEDDVMKYASDFKNQFGVKKKDGGNESVPIPSKLPSQDYLSQGQKFAETAFTIPTEKREKEKKIRVSPKLFGQPGTVDVDVIEEGEDVTYKNIAQRFANDLIISGTDLASGISELMRDMGAKQAKGIAKLTGSKKAQEFAETKGQLLYTPEGELTEYAKKATWATDPEAKTILGLNGLNADAKEMQESYQLPDSGVGKTLTALSSFAPDIIATGLLPEAKIAQGASSLAKLGSSLFNNFTKYLIVKDPLVAYKEAKRTGATAGEAIKEVPGAALKGGITGVTLAATGRLSSLATKGIMNNATKYLVGAGSSSAPTSMLKKAAEIGLTGKGGFITREGVNALTDVIGYGLLYPTGASLIERGELPGEEEITTGIGTALAFRIKGAFEGGIKFGEFNKLVEDVQSAKQGTAFINFMRATPESIQKVYNGPETANELQLQALEAAQRARKATDLEEKQKAVIQAATLSKAANVKQMADYVVNNKNDFQELKESTLPDEFKQAFLEKANLVNKSVNPVEIEKTNIGNRIKQASDFITQKEAELNSTQDPVAKAEIQVQLEQTNKLLKQQEQALKDLIFEQKPPRDLDLNEINSIKENKKLDNQEIDLQISKLDKNDPDYNEKLESLSKKKEEQNDYYDSVLKAAKETENVDISVIMPDEMAEIENIEIKRPKEQNINEFADRIAAGEKMESPEDLQFYENNKEQVEAILKEKAKPVVRPTEVDLTSAKKINASQNRYGIVKDGVEAGFIVVTNPENNVVKIKGVTVNEELRGKNIAGDAYVKLAESLAKKGISLESDSFDKMEPSATRVWEKLVNKGLAVKGKNSYKFNPAEIKVDTKKISIENKEYTTKTGRQKVTYENGQIIVRDIKTGKEVSAATRKKAIDEYVDAFDFEKGKTAEENITELPEGLNPEEANLFIIENSENPLELASIYFFEEPSGKAETKDEMIGEFGLGKITQDSFNRFGDRNLVTGGMARTYFKKDGLPLDVAAKEMSDYYEVEITPQDLAAFIVKYPSGSQAALRQFETRTANDAANKFKQLTGIDIDRKMAEKILNDKKNNLTDIEQELLNANYESEQQFQDAYWEAYKSIDKGAEASPVSEIKPTEAAKEKVEVKEEPKPEKPVKEAKFTEEEAINIDQVSNELMRQELEMAEYEKIKISDKEAYQKAKDKLLAGFDIENLLKEIESGKKKVIDDVDSILLGITNGTLAKEIDRNPKNIDELVDLRKRVIDALDITGSSLGRALRSRQLAIKPMETLSDFILDAQDAAGVDILTPAQKEEAFKDYEKYKKAIEDSERKILELEELNRQLLAEKEFNLIKKSVVKSKQKKDYAKERDEVFNSIKDKLKKVKRGESGLMAVPVPYAAQLIAISPEIGKLTKLYIEEGVEKLSDVVSKIHENIKNDIDGVTERDIRNVIAGKYNRPRPAKSDLDRKKALLKREAELLNQIEAVLAGEPKEEKKVIQKNQRIKELQDELRAAQQQMGYDEVTKIQQAEKRAESNIAEIEKKLEENDLSIRRAEKLSSPRLEELREKQKELRKELNKRRLEDAGVIVNKDNELKRLESATKRNETESKKIEKQIEEKDFEDKIKAPSFLENIELQKKYPKEYKEYLNSMVKKRDIKYEYEIKKTQERMARMTPSEKRAKIAKETFNTVKALKSSIDNSFVGVQGGLAFMANPLQGAKAFVESYKDMVNEGRFKRGLVEIFENKELMDLVDKSGLDILNPQEIQEKRREESMGGANLLEKSWGEIKGVKIIPAKVLTAPFERAYTSMGNNLRLNIFLKRISQLEKEGITYENNPEEIKAAARAVNELTGRGKLAKGLESSSEKLSWLIWSPKLLASTVNVLGLNDLGNALLLRKGYYGKLPPKAFKFATSQLASGIGMGVSIMAAIALLDKDKEVDADPRSVTFGQIKDKITGDAVNVYGRFTSVVRFITLMALGVKEVRGELKTVDTGKEFFKFFRGKFNPVAGTAYDALITRKTYEGKPYELSDLPKDLLAPLSTQDIAKFLEQDGTIKLLTKGFGTFNGLKIMNERDFIPQTQQKLYEKGLTSDYLDRLSIVDRRTKKPLTKEEFVKYSDMRDAILKEDLTRLYEDGVPVLGERKLKPYNKAKVDEIDKALDWLKSKATREAKDKLFGPEKVSMKSEIDEAYYELMKEKF
jgi:hypothetical protein